MNNLSILYYTNETSLPICDLAINEFNNFSKNLNLKKYIVSNRFLSDNNFNYNGFEQINANVPLENEGRHISKVLIKSLETIDTKYVLFMLDDMFVMNDIRKNNLEKIINVMDNENIDHFSLMSYGHNWQVLNIDYEQYGLPNDYIFKMDMSYMYMITLQPMIWKVSSFLELLKNNSNITIKEFDTSFFKNKKNETRVGPNSDGYYTTPDGFWDYGFTHCCFKRHYETTPYPFDDRCVDDNYFLFLWSETIAGGKFNLNRGSNCRNYLTTYFKEKNIDENHKIYGKFF